MAFAFDFAHPSSDGGGVRAGFERGPVLGEPVVAVSEMAPRGFGPSVGRGVGFGRVGERGAGGVEVVLVEHLGEPSVERGNVVFGTGGSTGLFRWTEAGGPTEISVGGAGSQGSFTAHDDGELAALNVYSPSGEQGPAAVSTPTGVVSVGTLAGATWSTVIDMNSVGQAIGVAGSDSGDQRPLIWSQADGIQPLDTVPAADIARPFEITDGGNVVGVSDPFENPVGWVWTDADGATEIPAPDGAVPADINEIGQVVGINGAPGGGDTTGFLWSEDLGYHDLGELAPRHINDAGLIVASSESRVYTTTVSRVTERVPVTFTLMSILGCDDEQTVDEDVCPDGGPDGGGSPEYEMDVSIGGSDAQTVDLPRRHYGDLRTGDIDIDGNFARVNLLAAQDADEIDIEIGLFEDDGGINQIMDIHPGDERETLEITVDMSTGEWELTDAGYGPNQHWSRGDGDPGLAGGHATAIAFDVSILSDTGDLDDDGLLDGWEQHGLEVLDVRQPRPVTDPTPELVNLDFESADWDADPTVKDLFVENDWADFDGTGATPGWETLTEVDRSFRLAAVPYPDGSRGPINLHVDSGGRRGGTDDLGGGNAIFLDGIADNLCQLDGDFYAAKEIGFDPNRRWAFRYQLAADNTDFPAACGDSTGGQGEIGGNDSLTLRRDPQTAMHELGHNLNLRHGGDENDNCKPNHLSIMNYLYDTIPTQVPLFTGSPDNHTLLDFAPARLIEDYDGDGDRTPRDEPPEGATVDRISLPLPASGPLDESRLDEVALDSGNTSHQVRYADPDGQRIEVDIDRALDYNQNSVPAEIGVIQNIDQVADIETCDEDNLLLEQLTSPHEWDLATVPFREFGDAADAALNPADERGRPATTEEAEAFTRSFAQTDLQLTITGPIGPVGRGETYDVTLAVEALDSNQASSVTVALDLSGLEYVGDQAGCTSDVAGELTCLVPQGLDPDEWGSIYRIDGPGVLVVPLRVSASSGTVQVDGTVTSHHNGLDEDPDPTNNSATLTIAVGEGPTCTLVGTPGSDVLVGTSGDDVICGLGGNDTLRGKQGNDILLGGDGHDTLEGDYGTDHLAGGAGNDSLLGNQDNDVLVGEEGNDHLQGGYGQDDLAGGVGDDTLDGNQDDDTVTDLSGSNTVNGGYGNDHITTGDAQDLIAGDQGADLIYAGAGADTITGGAGNDEIHGEAGADHIAGGTDADLLDGGEGTDTLNGDAGNDTLRGHDHDDILDGGTGADTLDGGNGTDACVGETEVQCEF